MISPAFAPVSVLATRERTIGISQWFLTHDGERESSCVFCDRRHFRLIVSFLYGKNTSRSANGGSTGAGSG